MPEERAMPERGAQTRPRPTIGLALGSGSARGWAHIGILRALLDAGILPDVVCGSSMGALVGAAHVTGQLDALERWALRFNRFEALRLIDLKLSDGGVIGGSRLIRALAQLHDERQMERLRPRFACSATDLMTGQEVVLREGDLLEAVHASLALPGIFSPVKLDDRWLVDGGLVNPVPVSLCRQLGADIVIAVNLNRQQVDRRRIRRQHRMAERRMSSALMDMMRRKGPSGSALAGSILASPTGALSDNIPKYLDVVMGAIYIMQDFITRSRLVSDPPDFILEPDLQRVNLMEFQRARECIAEGRACVEQALPEIAARDWYPLIVDEDHR
jgi:NTE family protein